LWPQLQWHEFAHANGGATCQSSAETLEYVARIHLLDNSVTLAYDLQL